LQGKKVSTLVRESIEEKIEQIEEKIFEEKMKRAYQELTQENLKISEDFKYVDSENPKLVRFAHNWNVGIME